MGQLRVVRLVAVALSCVLHVAVCKGPLMREVAAWDYEDRPASNRESLNEADGDSYDDYGQDSLLDALWAGQGGGHLHVAVPPHEEIGDESSELYIDYQVPDEEQSLPMDPHLWSKIKNSLQALRDSTNLQHTSSVESDHILTPAHDQAARRLRAKEKHHKKKTKADVAISAYCSPPNPCPLGQTSADGCLEDFENTARFSREFQRQQACWCDSEHMFACPEQDLKAAAAAEPEPAPQVSPTPWSHSHYRLPFFL